MRIVFRMAVLMAVLNLAGCQSRLNTKCTVEVTPNEYKQLLIDPPMYDQLVTVEFTSNSDPVSVCLCLGQDIDAVMLKLDTGKLPDAVLAKQENTKSGTLEAKVPEKTRAAVIFWGVKKNTP